MLTKLNRNINPLEKFQSTFISFKVILRLFALARGLPFKKRPGRLLKPAQTVLTFLLLNPLCLGIRPGEKRRRQLAIAICIKNYMKSLFYADGPEIMSIKRVASPKIP